MMIIRPATLADAAAISAVHCSTVDVWRDPYTRQPTDAATLDLFGRWYNGGPWMSAETCAVHLNALLLRGHGALVAEMEGNVVGEAEFYINREPAPFGPHLHVSILYIHREWQQRGIGQALIEAGVDYARTQHLVALTTQPESEAVGFYQRVGFQPWMRMLEMQATAGGDAPAGLEPAPCDVGPPTHLVLRLGRYQCGVQGWETLWPSLALPELKALRRSVWRGELDGMPVVLGLREQFRDPTQADGYAWLPPSAPLRPVVAALRGLAAHAGYSAVDLLLPQDALSELQTVFRLDYQTTVTLWKRDLVI
ncbi:MAG TPA: GNAT family N-acetyltransferase [Anaerolineae bacterium]|nr:GNAT family N-acetyltransferase [Anaerolineae bacterium]HQK14010.1 GNAT family N-acetyltransferase [Anaerolineae bacterium]